MSLVSSSTTKVLSPTFPFRLFTTRTSLPARASFLSTSVGAFMVKTSIESTAVGTSLPTSSAISPSFVLPSLWFFFRELQRTDVNTSQSQKNATDWKRL